MNISRFVGTVVGVWIVRVALNWIFYAKIIGRRYAQISSAHPGMLRTVIPAYIATDLIFALAFAFLFVKAGAALGGGVKGGVILGVIVAILSPVIGMLYEYYGVTYLPGGVELASAIFQVIAHAIEGAIAGLIYGSRRLWASAASPA
jgi:hypothetical protein